MHRILFQIGNLKIYTYGVMYALATLLATYIAQTIATKIYHYEDKDKLFDIIIYAIIGSIIGARLGYVIPFFSYYKHNLLEIINLRAGGLSVQGGIIGGLLFIWIISKKYKLNIWEILDWLAPATIIGMAIGRIGCFFNGCCLGVETKVPWGVLFKDTPFKGYRHPTQLYEMFGDFLIFIFLYYKSLKNHFKGEITLFFIAFYSILRFLVEFVREGTKYLGPLTISQWFCLLGIIFATFMYFKLKNNEKNNIQSRKKTKNR